jgi:hypothetical protein
MQRALRVLQNFPSKCLEGYERRYESSSFIVSVTPALIQGD